GLTGWTQALLGGTPDEQLEAAFASSGEYIALHGGLGASWINALYNDLLERSPSSAEVQAWLQVLVAGTPPATIAGLFTTSLEHEVVRVVDDYMTYLGRTPSQAEAVAWASLLVSHTLNNEGVIAQFIASTEYFGKHFSNVPDWIYAVYTDVLGR